MDPKTKKFGATIVSREQDGDCGAHDAFMTVLFEKQSTRSDVANTQNWIFGETGRRNILRF